MSNKNTKKKTGTTKNAGALKADNRNAPRTKKAAETKPVIEEVEIMAEVEATEVAAVEETPVDDADLEMETLLAKMDEEAIDASLLDAEEVETVATVKAEDVYAKMESELSVADPEDVAAVKASKAAKPAKQKRETVKAGESAPKRTVDPERLAQIVGEEEAQRLITGSAKLPVKVRDKAINALAAVTSGATLSGYTKYAIEHLQKAPENETTSKGIIEMLAGRGYTPGTASAQGQQQMVLLDYLGVAKRDGRTLRLNTKHPLMEALAA